MAASAKAAEEAANQHQRSMAHQYQHGETSAA